MFKQHLGVVCPIGLLILQVGGCIPSSEQNAFEPNIPETEKNQIEEIALLTPQMQDKRAVGLPEQAGKVLRGVHPKSHGCVRGEFTVFGPEELEPGFRKGLFKNAGKKFHADIRFSNAAVHTGDDLELGASGGRENGSRGMAIKLYDVDGEVFILDNERRNQDFLMINTPEFAFRNTTDYGRLTRALDGSPNAVNAGNYFNPEFEPPSDADQGKIVKAGIIASGGVVQKIKSKTVRNPLLVQYFGAAPFLFGKGSAMKFSVKPKNCPPKEMSKAFEETLDRAAEKFTKDEKGTLSAEYLSEALTTTINSDDICFDFMIQIRDKKEVDQLKIDDATTQWKNEQDNYKSVALLTIKSGQHPQTPKSKETCEALAFSPWHSLKEHQPLGSINRLRKDVYQASSYHRLGTIPQNK